MIFYLAWNITQIKKGKHLHLRKGGGCAGNTLSEAFVLYVYEQHIYDF